MTKKELAILKVVNDAIKENPKMYPEILQAASYAWSKYEEQYTHSLSMLWWFLGIFKKKELERINKQFNKSMMPPELVKRIEELLKK